MSEASISRRINRIKRLLKEYYTLEHGTLIDKHTELLRVFSIRASIHKNHPQKMKRVYISRRALKHFTESRKEQLSKNHTHQNVIENIYFAIDKIQETITNFDSYEYKPTQYLFVKDYSSLGKPFLRILVEVIENRLEIKSIHFRKIQKK